MAKPKSVYVCQQCGSQRARWEGRCTDCGAWNSFVEEKAVGGSNTRSKRSWAVSGSGSETAVSLDQDLEAKSQPRLSTGIKELNRVLGGGLVPGSFVLVGGDPGIGKSTLLLQMSAGLASNNGDVLYLSAEESVQQISLRAKRLGIRTSGVKVQSESSMDAILNLALTQKPQILIVDSIQTVFLEEVQSAPGSVSQVRECAAKLMNLAKVHGVTVFVIGHVTKEGTLAGPRVLEHMVDTVLSFEGDGHQHYRLLRAIKNRFGATNELGVFEMVNEGLREVENPSAVFLEDREKGRIGAAIFPALEGSRPMLVELQALANTSPLPMPRRTSLGVDLNRVHMLAAVLDKFVDLDLAHEDLFVNVVGGLKLSEPACDLAVAAAFWSTKCFRPLPFASVFMGEIGLTGEVRGAIFVEDRLKEAAKLGFQKAYVPKANKKNLNAAKLGIEIHYVADVKDFIGQLARASRPNASGPAERHDAFESSEI